MKTVLLMRHAKSSWKEKELDDIERPLNKRGKKDAPRVGEVLFDKELTPQMILCSPALRARQTAELVADKCEYMGEITYLDSFYLAEPSVYESALCSLPDNIERVMLIGHNPGMEGLVQILGYEVESLPTASVAYLALPIDHWSEMEGKDGNVHGDIIQLWRPRDLKSKKN